MYLSGALKQNQSTYYRLLSAVRDAGDWESWVRFFLEAVEQAAGDAERNIVTVATLINADRRQLMETPTATPATYRLFERLPLMPRFTIAQVQQALQTTAPTATAAVNVLQGLGIVREATGQRKNRNYAYDAYIEALKA